MQEIFISYHQLQQELLHLHLHLVQGQAVTRVGEAATTTKLATHIEAPVLLV